ncbi:MAG: hypothetical protein LUE12_08945 [Ruminococcus sp.]|nr:hypothetical protein [Ruminococcus sp.]
MRKRGRSREIDRAEVRMKIEKVLWETAAVTDRWDTENFATKVCVGDEDAK